MKKETINFGDVPKEIRRGGGQFNPRVPDGEYELKVVGVQKRWKDNDKSNPPYFEWRFQISSGPEKGKQPYTYTTSLKPEALFNLRNLIHAVTAKNVAGRSVNFDPETLVGKHVGAVISEEEYNKKITSRIQDVFPAAELEGADEEEETDDEEEETETDDEDEDEDIEEVDLDEL